jgi:hypothetical protein
MQAEWLPLVVMRAKDGTKKAMPQPANCFDGYVRYMFMPLVAALSIKVAWLSLGAAFCQ